jgi:DNA helicase-2/ATP-dependent DNA helicase PcrA
VSTPHTPGARPLAAAPRSKVPATTFFSLADDVLSETGRPTLGEHHRGIIEVRDDDQVLQILAGPGAGKTEVLVWRVLYELFVRAAEASKLMVTTFTRKAAQELDIRMVERSDAFMDVARRRGLDVADPRVHDLRTGTIHALCDELLNEFDDQHLAEGKQVIDEVETRLRLLQCRNWAFKDKGRQLLKEVLEMDQVTSLFKPPWRDHLAAINEVDLTLALLNQHVETWIPRCGTDQIPNGIESVHGPEGLTEHLIQIQKRWSARLESDHAMDYPLLQKRFLEHQPSLTGKLDHVFVDEFQDTNPIQYAIHTGWVNHGGVRLTVVGDDDQALYRWRGSDISCFEQLGPDCTREDWTFRKEVLQENNRSTATIVSFAHAFREATVLADDSLAKTVVSPVGNEVGVPVRLLQDDWLSLCAQVSGEIDAFGAGRILDIGQEAPPTIAILMASTAEVETKTGTRPALDLHRALEARGLRVYNPRNKSAARPGSPVHDLLALLSYLIDPVTEAPVGKPKTNGERRMKQVWASCNDAELVAYAISEPPGFYINTAHAAIQKRFIKAGGKIGAPSPTIAPLIGYLDRIRKSLVNEDEGKIRLSLGGLVSRLLSMDPFRSSGYNINLFRQALFTQLLEANVSVTRTWGKSSLENPMVPRCNPAGKMEWPKQYWEMLAAFGQLIEAGGQDDLEVEAFSEDAIGMLTFHQAKGLEFDHVYVAMTGKKAEPSAVLATELFSGKTPKYEIVDGHPHTRNKRVMALATADREREIYVAITRAKQSLTILHAPGDGRPMMQLNDGLRKLFDDCPSKQSGAMECVEWPK